MASESHKINLTVKGKARVRQMTDQVEGSLKRVDRAVGALAGRLGLLAGAGGFGLLIKGQIDAAREADKWSKAIGVNIEQLTAWQFAGESMGLSGEKIADIMKDTSEKIADAYRNNAGEAKEALQSLNLSVAQMAQLSPDKQLLAIADALESVGTQGERVQIMEALSSNASLLLPLLEDNAAELERLTDLANRTGAVMTQEEVDILKRAGRALNEMDASLSGLSQTIAVTFAPAVTYLVDKLNSGLTWTLDSMRSSAEGFVDWWIGESGVTGLLDPDKAEAQRRAWVEKFAPEKKDIPVITVTPVAQQGLTQDEKDKLQKDLDRVSNALRSQEQVLYDALVSRQAIVEQAAENNLISEQRKLDLLFQLNNDYEDRLTRLTEKGLTDREKFQQLSARRQAATVIGELVQVTQGVAQHNRKLFELNKAAGIANAVVNTYEGVTKTLAKYPWPLSGVMAAAHLAAGLAQVDAIRSASFGGNGGAAPSLAGGTAAPPITPVGQDSAAGSAAESGKEITIRIVGDGEFKDLVVKSIEEAEANDEIRILSD